MLCRRAGRSAGQADRHRQARQEGYCLTKFDSPKASGKTISDFVAGMNALLGVDTTEAQAMLNDSMLGWDVAAAKNDGGAR